MKKFLTNPVLISVFVIFVLLSIGATSIISNLQVKNLNANNMSITDLGVGGIDVDTNNFSGNTFLLGTNSTITTSSDVDISAVGNIPTTTTRWGQLNIIATANINVTNPATWETSDMVSTRVLTNGNRMTIGLEVQAGLYTNAYIVQVH